ncbi:putative ubiquitin fusion degradation protein UFD1 [Histomonas meleagridis]|uniref:putative ubiquitin fusion degradation protein UFD1 n=1 Tax=Histomonas meleagridis TaxID=135588 RepID=UPI00355A2E9C|nr:putative ubiquitin fusion degradation protein UFD1 [Histomonas meleagridis]KAH0802404.1 putative ubiquitin fusion degradation protein UFD1 [Histomonas meleagridis]
MRVQNTFLAVSPETFGDPSLNYKGKVILPELILHFIEKNNIQKPILLFSIKNPITNQEVAAGVESFNSDVVSCVIPKWMMETINIEENDKVIVSLVDLPPAESLTLQPLTNEFPSAVQTVLQVALRPFPCLTIGSILPLSIFNKIHQVKVLYVEPPKMASTFNVDVNLEMIPSPDKIQEFLTHNWGEEEDCYEPKSKAPNKFIGKPHSLR